MSLRINKNEFSLCPFTKITSNQHSLNLPQFLQVKTKLKGHQRIITGLDFSHSLNVLVSYVANSQVHGFFYCCIQSDFVILILKFAKISQTRNVLFSQPNVFWQLCLWGIDGWDKINSKDVIVQSRRSSPTVGDTRVQFRNDQVQLLVMHESHLSIYEASKLDRLCSVSTFKQS